MVAPMNATWTSDMHATNMVVDCGPWRNCSNIGDSPGANVIVPAVTSVTGIIGNMIAIVVLQHSTKREQARTVFYVLVAGLAWTDLLGILFTTWPVIVVYVYGDWPGGTGLCNYHAFAMISFALITPCIVCTMAIERYLGIRHGYFYKSHVNRPRVRLLMLMQWVVVLLFAAFPLFGFGQYSIQYPGTWCFLNMHPNDTLDAVYGFIIAVVNLFMITMIVGCNIIVTGTLLRMRYRRKHENSPANDKHRFRSRKQREIEIQMVVLLIGITCVFTVCWAPLMFQILINQFSDHNGDHRQDLLTVRLASINQILDPWVYILFRKVFFTKCWRCLGRACWWRRNRKHSVFTAKSTELPAIKAPNIFAPRMSTTNTQTHNARQMVNTPLTLATERLREDSGTESGPAEMSTSADSIFFRPEVMPTVQPMDAKSSRSWCCQYNPDPSRCPRSKLRTQSTQTPHESYEDDEVILVDSSQLLARSELQPLTLEENQEDGHVIA